MKLRFNYENVLIYCDPPYVLSTRHGKQYQFEMSNDDHEELLDALLNHKGMVIISGYDSGLYQQKLSNWYQARAITYSQICSKKEEILWMNFEPSKQLRLTDFIL